MEHKEKIFQFKRELNKLECQTVVYNFVDNDNKILCVISKDGKIIDCKNFEYMIRTVNKNINPDSFLIGRNVIELIYLLNVLGYSESSDFFEIQLREDFHFEYLISIEHKEMLQQLMSDYQNNNNYIKLLKKNK